MSKPLKAFIDSNPELGNGLPPARPMPGQGFSVLQTLRAQSPGGHLLDFMQSEDVLYFERVYRVLPPDGLYTATAAKPVTMTLGAVQVPRSMVLVILDYSFDIYRFSGAQPGNFFPIEENSLSTQVGWDIKVNTNRPANTQYQITPTVQTQSRQTFPEPSTPTSPAQGWQFDIARAQQTQNPAGPALSMMPQRRHRPGLLPISNTYVARSSEMLSVTCSVIGYIPIPVAFFEATIMGTLLPQNVYDAYQRAAVPHGDPIVAKMPGTP